MSNHPNRAPRHGHLPGHIRDTFSQALDLFVESEPDRPLPSVSYEIQYRERQISVAEACRLVRNCTDILPGEAYRQLCDRLNVSPASQTYAAAAQDLLAHLQRDGLVNAEDDIARRRLYDARDAAWRDLEDWVLTEQSNDSSNPTSKAEDPRFGRSIARWSAKKVVDQWRALVPARLPMTDLERLVAAIVAAEDAIPAGAGPLYGIPVDP